MNNKELLKLAAKACNIKFVWGVNGPSQVRTDGEYFWETSWNPLAQTDIGRSQCLQMEIDLKMDIKCLHFAGWRVGIPVKHDDGWRTHWVEHEDRHRASTMAAAELGRLIR